MRRAAFEFLRCPECRGELLLHDEREADGEVVAGTLECSECGATHAVVEGIPVLLPASVPNPGEAELRRRISEEASPGDWRAGYDSHHSRTLAELRLERFLAARGDGVRVLDIGVGWAVPYLPFAGRLELWGLDFSLESLVLARRIFEHEGAPPPNLVCASLNAIPLGGLSFDLAQSVQVYQHIERLEDVRASLRFVFDELLAPGGELWVENLSYASARLVHGLRSLGRDRLEPEQQTDDYFLRRYSARQMAALLDGTPSLASLRVRHSENLFHPEVRMTPRSRAVARAELALERTPLARAMGRQVRLEARRG